MKRIELKIAGTEINSEFLLRILIFVFLVMKMFRSFAQSSVAGGLWNYIQIVIVLFGMVTVVLNMPKLTRNPALAFIVAYSFLALINNMFYLELNQDDLYHYMMIAYPMCILIIVMRDCCMRETAIEREPIYKLSFFVIALIYIVSMLTVGEYSTGTGAVADAYYVLTLLPLAIIYFKNKLIPIALCGFALIISGKRAGIIVFAVMIIVYYVITGIQTRDAKAQISSFLKLCGLAAVFVIVFIYVGNQFNGGLVTKFERMLEGDSAGRYERWESLMDIMNESGIKSWVLGHSNSVTDVFGGNAHNDFLEILYNYGIFPVLCCIGFYTACVFEAVNMLSHRYEYTANFIMSVICSVGLSMFSFYFIAPTFITCGMMCVGYLIIDFRKKYVPDSVLLMIR